MTSDPNEEAARVVRESTANGEKALPGDLEEAWVIWSRGIKNVDQRTRTLLKAAFEAGYGAGQRHGPIG